MVWVFGLFAVTAVSLQHAQTLATDAPKSVPAQLQRLFDPESVQRMLRSSDSREQAWGAWLAGQGRLNEAIPRLQQVVEARLAGKDELDDTAPLDAALDALIQLDAELRMPLLTQVFRRRSAASLMLMSRAGPDADAPLLLLLGRERGTNWFAAANLLLRRRSPGLASALLRDLEISASIVVYDHVPSGMGVLGGSNAGLSARSGGFGLAPGYPPLAVYGLVVSPTDGDILLASGPKTVYLRRIVSAPGETPAASTEEAPGPQSEDRLQYLAALLGFGAGMPLRASETRAVQWRNKESLESEIQSLREDILRRHAQLVQMLLDSHLLAPGEASAALPPRIDLLVHDRCRAPNR
jgi:hypothetical protein